MITNQVFKAVFLWPLRTLLALFFMMSFGRIQAQEIPQVLQEGDSTFFQIYDRINKHYLRQEEQGRSEQEDLIDDDEKNRFYKWAHFWQHRLDENGMAGSSAMSSMANFIDGGLTVCETTNDDDKDWRSLGPHNSSGALDASGNGSNDCSGLLPGQQNQGRIEAISVHPTNPNDIVAGGFNGGIWRSTNGGNTWVNTTDDEGYSIVGTSDIVRHPADPNVLYASTSAGIGIWGLGGHSYGVGVIMSTDGGNSWSATGFSPSYSGDGRVNAIAIDPNSTLANTTIYIARRQAVNKWNGNHLAAGSWSQVYVDWAWFSGPFHWGPVNNNDIEVEDNGAVWFANIKGIYRIPPGSTSASLVTNYTVPSSVQGTTTCGIVNPCKRESSIDINKQGHVVFIMKYWELDNACLGGNNFSFERHIYKTTNSGLTWTGGVNAMPFDPPFYGTFAVSPYNSNVIYAEHGNRCIYKSTNFGLTFSSMDNKVNHVDARVLIAYDGVPGDATGSNDILYLGTDGGPSVTTNGHTWVDIVGEGLACTNNYGLGVTESNSDFIFTGAQDGSINFYNEGSWYETLPGGDNGDALIDPTNILLVYQEYQGALRRTTVSGNNTSWGAPITAPDATWLHPLLMNPNDPNEIMMGTQNLHISANQGGTWTTIPHGTTHPKKRLSSMAMSEINTDILYYSVYGHWWDNSNTGSHPNNYGGLIRADRSSGSWVISDVTNNLNLKCQGGSCGLYSVITDVAVDPDDEDNVWVTFGGFRDGEKVFHSTNGGASWTNVSSCLPNIPFTAIVYQQGSNNRVYVGSDFGVFYKDDSMTDWAFYGNNGPRTIVADMEINRCANKIVVATQGRGLWEVDMIENAEKVVSGGTITWNTPRLLTNTHRITSGTTLKIENTTIRMAKKTQLLVEAGATLIVDNSTLTNGCGEFWRGIEVWGDATQNQFSSGGTYAQGRLIVRNNSVIEYSNNAVKLGKAGDWMMDYTGGIIQANNSTFRNNKRAVEFLKYRNFHPSIPSITYNNRSYFRDCRFVTDEDLPENQVPNAFITMWAVDFVGIYSCTLENINPNASSIYQLGKGIYTEDASFRVSGCGSAICPITNPCCNPNPNIFRNLYYGVWGKKISSTRKYIVDANTFENCRFSVYNDGVDYAQITRNDFDIGYSPDASQTWSNALVNWYGTKYRIEENNFTRNSSAFTYTAGAYMIYTGEDNNEIYKNSFDDMTYANIALGNNGSLTANPDGSFDGLAYFCNEQTATANIDLYALWGNGIRHYQGGLLSSGNYLTAGNTFSNTNNNPQSDAYNLATQNIIYIYGTGPNEEPLYYNPIKVLPVSPSNIQENTCPTRFGGLIDIEIVKVRYRDLKDELAIKVDNYIGKIDEGRTTELVALIQRTELNDPELNDQLLSISPYLSTDVLETIIDYKVFNGEYLYNIFNSNTDALRQTNLYEHPTTQEFLTRSQLSSLLRNMGNITIRGKQEAEITYIKALKDQAAHEIINILMDREDEEKTVEDRAEILGWLKTFETLASTYTVVDYLYDDGQANAAVSMLNEIPAMFDLSTEQATEHSEMVELYAILESLQLEGRNEYLLTTNEKVTVTNLADNGQGRAQTRARNIMSFFYGVEYPFDIELPARGREAEINGQLPATRTQSNTLEKVAIELLPNPASDELNVRYLSPSIYGNTGRISIIDQGGQIRFEQEIDDQEEHYRLDVSQWPTGMYYCIYQPTQSSQKVIPIMISH
ncbi:MAG: T9SS type A sorting domain-containing protein [Bacteroidota bacterium]